MQKNLAAEFLGTFWLVFGGCGSAVLAAAYPELGIGFAGVALAFGLTVVTMAYAVGGISGGHFNPAVSLGLVVAGRFPAARLIPYIVAQVIGAIVAAAALYLIASGKAGFELGGFAANGYGEHSPGGYSLLSALLIEILLTMFFLIIILGSTSSRVPAGTRSIQGLLQFTNTSGSYNVAEGFGELSLVPISHTEAVDWLELSLAARAFRYNTFGSGVTWKTGALYRPIMNGSRL